MLNTLIFDVDMTLVDSLDACTKGANLMADHFGLPNVSRQTVAKSLSLPTQDFWQAVWGRSRPEWMAYFNEEVVPKLNNQVTVYPGTEEFLASARAKGFLLAVGTNRTNPWIDLAQMNLAKYFDTAVGISDVPRPKPAPDIILTVLKQLGDICDEAVYVGDSLSDMASAKAAGVKGLGLIQAGLLKPGELTAAGAWMVRRDLASCRDLFDLQ
ncbi:MAG: HAD family hydrolase [Deltaproteobacteria bacterium]|jgi:HAD superfamily hydrolase (TIGR01509 family)|nr:HAD family hydrolase [Deltaproteobacteria bacterium]